MRNEEPKIRKIHRRLTWFVNGGMIVISVGYFAYILAYNWSGLVSLKWQLTYSQIALFFILYSISLFLAGLGWDLLVGHFTRISSLRKNLKYYILTAPLRRLPAPLTYLFGRIYLYSQDGVYKSAIAVVSFLEWILILLSGAVVCLWLLPFWISPWIPYSSGVAVGVLVAGGLLIHPKVIRFIFRLLVKKAPPISFKFFDILLWLVIYILVWIGGGLTLYIIVNSLYPLPLTSLPTIIGAWVLSGVITTLVTVTSIGFGLKELTLSFLLSFLLPSPLPVVAALLMRLCLFLCEIIWGALIFFASLLPKRSIA